MVNDVNKAPPPNCSFNSHPPGCLVVNNGTNLTTCFYIEIGGRLDDRHTYQQTPAKETGHFSSTARDASPYIRKLYIASTTYF